MDNSNKNQKLTNAELRQMVEMVGQDYNVIANKDLLKMWDLNIKTFRHSNDAELDVLRMDSLKGYRDAVKLQLKLAEACRLRLEKK